MKLRHLPVLFALLLPVAAFAQNAAIQTALDYLSENASVLLLLEADISDVAVVDAYASRRSGTTHVYLRQQHDGIGVVDANLTLNVHDPGNVFHVAGSFEQRGDKWFIIRGKFSKADAQTIIAAMAPRPTDEPTKDIGGEEKDPPPAGGSQEELPSTAHECPKCHKAVPGLPEGATCNDCIDKETPPTEGSE